MAHFLPFLCFLMMLPQVSGIRQTSEGAERVVCIERSSVFHSAAGMQVLPTQPTGRRLVPRLQSSHLVRFFISF